MVWTAKAANDTSGAKFGMFLIILIIPAFSLLAIGLSFINHVVVSCNPHTFLGAPILFSFLLPVCNARPIDIYIYRYIYIYIICIPTRNRNKEFIL